MLQIILKFAITFLAGFSGAMIAKRFRLPAWGMTGALFAVMIIGKLLGTEAVLMPMSLKPLTQAVAGAAVGITVTRKNISDLKRLVAPIIFFIISMFAISISASFIMAKFTALDSITALLSCAPGGFMDMSLLSYDFDANTSQVTLLQLMRLLVALGVFPSITKFYLTKKGIKLPDNSTKTTEKKSTVAKQASALNVVLTLTVAIVFGIIGYNLDIPAGAITTAMISVAIFQLITSRGEMSIVIRRIAQIIAGSLIGITAVNTNLSDLKNLIVPFIIVLCEYLIINYLLAPFIASRFNLDLPTAMMACTPAGISDIALIAEEMGGEQSKVMMFHIVRLVSILVFFPIVAQIIVVNFG